MSRFFEPDVCYPSDDYGGAYVEFQGVVESVSWLKVEISTVEHGVLSGYVDDFYEDRPQSMPRKGDIAVIRCYNWGGGWYPDDRIMSWIQKPLERMFDENN